MPDGDEIPCLRPWAKRPGAAGLLAGPRWKPRRAQPNGTVTISFFFSGLIYIIQINSKLLKFVVIEINSIKL
jgi:hypothetical protein